MGWLAKLARGIWQGIKAAARFVWYGFVRPAAERVATWVGVEQKTTQETLDRVEAATARAVEILETDVGPVIRDALDLADRAIRAWARRAWERWQTALLEAIERLAEYLRARTRRVDPTPIVETRLVPVDRERSR
jgi:hypothetical protein